MKKSSKLFIPFLAAVFMVLFFALPSRAASYNCTCGHSNVPHTDDHEWYYLSNGKSGHRTVCYDCYYIGGHDYDCAMVTVGKDDIHACDINGAYIVCRLCGYKECGHFDAKWQIKYNTVGGTGTDENTCIKYCGDCKKIIQTKRHVWKYKQISSSNSNYHSKHEVYCADCSYVYSGSDEGHIWKYLSYKKPAVPKNPVTSDSAITSAAQDHMAYVQCKKCGHKTTVRQSHSFKNGTCTKCKLYKDSNLKITKLKKNSVKTIHKVSKYKPYYTWSGGRWIYHKGGTGHNYTTTMKISWKKNSKAYGYYCSLATSAMKTGTYITDFNIAATAGWNKKGGYNVVTRNNTAILSMSGGKKSKSINVYVAPISKYGFIGKWTKLTVKVK